ncbi:putative permease component of an ABC superfamily transporter, partial [Yokenella regensburgei ATCC 49455]
MKIATLTLMLAALAVMSVTLALISGAYHLDLAQVIALIAQPDTLSPEDRIVFWQIRLPRILAALLLGAALAGAGTTYQGMFR